MWSPHEYVDKLKRVLPKMVRLISTSKTSIKDRFSIASKEYLIQTTRTAHKTKSHRLVRTHFETRMLENRLESWSWQLAYRMGARHLSFDLDALWSVEVR